MNKKKFIKAMTDLMVEHDVCLWGNLTIRDPKDIEEQYLTIEPFIQLPDGIKDMCGDFAVFDYKVKETKWESPYQKAPEVSSFQPFQSPVTFKMINNTKELREHNKEHNCIQVGNEHVGAVAQMKEEAKEKEYDAKKIENYNNSWS